MTATEADVLPAACDVLPGCTARSPEVILGSGLTRVSRGGTPPAPTRCPVGEQRWGPSGPTGPTPRAVLSTRVCRQSPSV